MKTIYITLRIIWLEACMAWYRWRIEQLDHEERISHKLHYRLSQATSDKEKTLATVWAIREAWRDNRLALLTILTIRVLPRVLIAALLVVLAWKLW
jgi:type VI protein secretion system component VasF